jgi:all-trans-retinol 13,14-reductase
MREPWSDLDAPPPWLFLSLTDQFKPRESADGDQVTAEVFTLVPGEKFAAWRDTVVHKRGEEYDDLKSDLSDKILGRLEEAWPGFRESIRFVEAATPLTITSCSKHLDGAAYGLAPIPGRYSDRALRVATGVPGVLLTGQDIATAGVLGAFYGGLVTASAVLRCNVPRALVHQFA